MTANLMWYELAEFDDFLTASVVDQAFYWSSIRKVFHQGFVSEDKLLTKTETLKLIRNHLIFPINEEAALTPSKKLNYLMTDFLKLEKVKLFLKRYPNEVKIREFVSHAKRYFSLFQRDCGFDICTTDRYFSKSKSLEACIVAKKIYDPNEEIKYLYGCLAQIGEEEVNNLDQNDFSIINISSKSNPCLMLGPTRFVNHDCNGNAKFWSNKNGMTIVAIRKILIGEEITVTYATNYFGKNNKDCLCATCERDGNGSYAPREEDEDGFHSSVSDDEDQDTKIIEQIILNDDDDSNSDGSDKKQFYPTPESDLANDNNVYEVVSDSDQSESDYEIESIEDPVVISKIQEALGPVGSADTINTNEKNLEKNSKKSKELSVTKRLRPRTKRKLKKKVLSTIDLYPIDNSPDSFREKSRTANNKANIVEFTQRKIVKTFQRLYNTHLYDPEYQDNHNIYDCQNCGCYFEYEEESFNALKYNLKPSCYYGRTCKPSSINLLYCPKCLRHFKIYKMAWPLTKADLMLSRHRESIRQFLTFWPTDRQPIERISGPNYYRRYDKNGNLEENNTILGLESSDSKKVPDRDTEIRKKLGDLDYVFFSIKDLRFKLREDKTEGYWVPLKVNKLSLEYIDKLNNEWVVLFDVYEKYVKAAIAEIAEIAKNAKLPSSAESSASSSRTPSVGATKLPKQKPRPASRVTQIKNEKKVVAKQPTKIKTKAEPSTSSSHPRRSLRSAADFEEVELNMDSHSLKMTSVKKIIKEPAPSPKKWTSPSKKKPAFSSKNKTTIANTSAAKSIKDKIKELKIKSPISKQRTTSAVELLKKDNDTISFRKLNDGETSRKFSMKDLVDKWRENDNESAEKVVFYRPKKKIASSSFSATPSTSTSVLSPPRSQNPNGRSKELLKQKNQEQRKRRSDFSSENSKNNKRFRLENKPESSQHECYAPPKRSPNDNKSSKPKWELEFEKSRAAEIEKKSIDKNSIDCNEAKVISKTTDPRLEMRKKKAKKAIVKVEKKSSPSALQLGYIESEGKSFEYFEIE